LPAKSGCTSRQLIPVVDEWLLRLTLDTRISASSLPRSRGCGPDEFSVSVSSTTLRTTVGSGVRRAGSSQTGDSSPKDGNSRSDRRGPTGPLFFLPKISAIIWIENIYLGETDGKRERFKG
jgi:hypothetical protein